MKTFRKDPAALLDYCWNWVEWLGNDTIDTYNFIMPEDLTLESSSENEGIITAWISGGTVFETYIVTCEIITLAGRKDQRSSIFKMIEK